MYSAPSGSRTRVSTLGTLNDNRYTNGALGERFLPLPNTANELHNSKLWIMVVGDFGCRIVV